MLFHEGYRVSDRNSIVEQAAIAQEIENYSRLSHAQSRGLELLHIGVTVKVLGLAIESTIPRLNVPRSGEQATSRGRGGRPGSGCNELVTRENSTHDGREGTLQ